MDATLPRNSRTPPKRLLLQDERMHRPVDVISRSAKIDVVIAIGPDLTVTRFDVDIVAVKRRMREHDLITVGVDAIVVVDGRDVTQRQPDAYRAGRSLVPYVVVLRNAVDDRHVD